MSRTQKKLLEDLQKVIRKYSGDDYNPEVILEVLSRSMRRTRKGSKNLHVVRSLPFPAARPEEILREQRKRIRLTISALGKRVGIAQPNLSAMESGKRPIGPAVARKLAKYLGVDHRIFL